MLHICILLLCQLTCLNYLQEAFGGVTASSEPEHCNQGAAKFFTSGKPAQQQALHKQPFGAFKAAADALAKAAAEVGMSAQFRAALHLDIGADGPANDPSGGFVMTTTTQVYILLSCRTSAVVNVLTASILTCDVHQITLPNIVQDMQCTSA